MTKAELKAIIPSAKFNGMYRIVYVNEYEINDSFTKEALLDFCLDNNYIHKHQGFTYGGVIQQEWKSYYKH